jgi:high affinity Mn2+ porin
MRCVAACLGVALLAPVPGAVATERADTKTITDWTGFYIGGHVDAATTRANVTAADPTAFNASRTSRNVFGGIDFGYNYQLPSGLVLGAEADISFPNSYPSDAAVWDAPTPNGALRQEVDYVATLRGRVGYASGNWLTYVTGGLAWSESHYFRQDVAGGDEERRSKVRPGWAAGGGVEYAFQRDWSVRLEYLYTRIGSADVVFSNGATYGSNFDLQSLRLGLNWRPGAAAKAPDADSISGSDRWEIHGQTTYIQQSYPSFRAPYSGPNSLSPAAQSRETWTTSLFLGAKLWDGGEFYYNPEFLQGFGVSDTVGAGGYPNGEAQKSNFLFPHYNTSRLFLRQTFGFGGGEEKVESSYGQMGGKRDVNRLTLQVGKFSVHDIFDNNAYANDSRVDFMNWAVWAAGAFDYPADKVGLTYGATAEWNQKEWALRGGYFLIGDKPNSNDFDNQVFNRGAYIAEYERRYELFGRGGKLRLIGWFTRSFAGTYGDALTLVAATPGLDPTTALESTRQTRTKYGYVVNLEQGVTDDVGLFSRWSWNNGKTEINAYADIDASFVLGTQIKGTQWGRPDDKIGVAGVVNTISKDHRDYVAAGGMSILIGDGQLNYRPEQIIETYYAYQLRKDMFLTFDYQFMANPAYNADRGPVHFFSGRFHAEF